jgi:hypothetical protein
VTFVFPMAGESRRFAQAGYRVPKFMLMVHGAALFDHAVGGFRAYFAEDRFVFITRDDAGAAFAARRCAALGVAKADVVALGRATSGQAETVFLGLEQASIGDDETIIIFNIDTFRPGYMKPSLVGDPSCAGYLEVFQGSGSGWSYVAEDPMAPGRVAAVAEKLPISELCCTGLYHFRKAGDFRWAWRHPAPAASEAEKRERYVAPLYNALIARGDHIAFTLVSPSDVVLCGTPQEYEKAGASEETGHRLRP